MTVTGLGLMVLLVALSASQIFNPPANLYWPSGGDARCVNLTDVPILYPGVIIPPVCYDYILWPNSVYVDNNTFIRNVLGRTGMGGTWTSPDCLLSGYLQWCTLMFRPCYDVPIPAGYGNGTIAVGQYPCRYYCTFSRTACYGAIVDSVKATPGYTEQDLLDILNCDPPWPVLYGVAPPGVDIFPNGTYTAPVSADGGASYFNVTFPCYDGNINITTPPPDALCPQGMYFFEGVCYFNCPEPIITDSEYDAITTMLSVMGWISLVSAAFLAITFLMDPEKRKFPANLSIFFILCIMCLSFSFCIGSMAGWRNVWCDDNDRPNTFGGPACTIQGIIFVYFTLASVLWWLVLSVNLLLMVTKVQPNNLTLRWMDYFRGLRTGWRGWLRWETVFIGYHMFAWLPPFISLIISLGAERLGFLGHDLWCTIHSGDPVRFVVDSTGQVGYEGGDPANIWNLILLTVPILSTVAIGICILIFVVIWSIWKIGWRFFYQQWRLFFFIMFFIWIYTFVFSFQIHLAVQADKQYQAYTEYINCKNYQYILQAAGSPLPPIPCPDEVDSQVSFPLWFIVAFNEASQGLLLFLLYGTSFRFFRTWYLLFTNPKALVSSKFAASSGDSSPAFTVEGRKVTSDSGVHSSNSKHMVDEIEGDESQWTTSETSSSDSSSRSDDDNDEEGGDVTNVEMEEIKS